MKFYLKTCFATTVMLTLIVLKSWSQGANTCSAALSNQISVPNSFNNLSTCSNTNTYIGAGACSFNFYYFGFDRFFAFTSNQNGFVQVNMSNISASLACMPSLSVFSACPGTSECLAFNVVSIMSGNTGSLSVIIPVTTGQSYVVVLDAYSSAGSLSDCYSFDIDFSYILIPTQPACTNIGFDDGNLNGWFASTGSSRQSASGNLTPTYDISSIGVVSGRHTLFTSGVDPYGNFPRVAPGGGSTSLRLGNQTSSAEAEQVAQKFIVTPANSSFTYKYAVVFQDPNHNSNEQPFFKALVKDQNGQIIQCSEFIVSAAGNLPGFLVSPLNSNVLYKPWSTVNVDLFAYIGQEVTVEFTTGDCSQGGHFGYAYIDAVCSPSFIIAQSDTTCPNQALTLQAPSGYASYLWTPGNNTNQNYTVAPTFSTVYTLTTTSFNGCTRSFDVPVTVVPNPVASFTTSSVDCNGNVSLTSTSTISSGSIVAYQWNILGVPSGNGTSLTTQLPGQGSFPVSLQATSELGCQSTSSQSVTVPNCVLTVNLTGGTICPGACFDLQAQVSNANGSITYNWSNGGPNAANWQVCPTSTTTYTLTVTTSTGQSSSVSVTVNVSALPVINFTSVPVTCNSASDGSITAVVTPTGVYNYNWSNGGTASTISNLQAGNYSLTVTNASNCQATASYQIPVPPSLSASLSSQPASCGQSNGSITLLSVNPANSNLTVTVNGTANTSVSVPYVIPNLSSGNYSIQIETSQGCSFSTSQSVSAIAGPSAITATSTPASCGQNNGCIQVAGVTGGAAPYQYSLNGGTFQTSNQFCSLASGNYSLTVRDANNCEITQTSTVSSTAGLSASIQVIQVPVCASDNNGILQAQIIGGTAPHTILWSTSQTTNQIQNLSPGTYTLTVTDATGCTASDQVTIAQPADFTVNHNVLHETCGSSNGSIQLTISGSNGPFEVNFNNQGWSSQTNYTNLNSDVYSILVRDANQCSKSLTVTVNGSAAIQAISATSTPSSCGQNNGCIQVAGVTGGTAPYQYSLNGGTFQTSNQFCSLASGNYLLTVRDVNNCEITQTATVSSTAGLNASIQVIQVPVCASDNNGILQAQITGGTAPHTILWSTSQTTNQIQNLSPGTYTLTVTDATGCTASDQVTIAQPADFTITATSTFETCGNSNGSLTVIASGSNSPFTYSIDYINWQSNPTFTGLNASSYTIWTRDVNGCEKQYTHTISAIHFISSFSITSVNATCGQANGEIEVLPINSTIPLEYSLNGNQWTTAPLSGFIINQLNSGNYTLQLRDTNQCFVTQTVSINQFNSPSAITFSTTPASCGMPNGCITINSISGGQSPYVIELNSVSAQLSTAVCQLTDQSYTVTVTDANGCTLNEQVTVPSLAGLSAQAVINQHVSCFNGNNGNVDLQITGGLAPYQILWNDGNTSFNRSNLSAGTYSIQISDATQCSITLTVTIVQPDELIFTTQKTDITCGLSNGEININSTLGGVQPYQFSLNGTQGNGNWNQLNNGTYTITVTDANQCQVQELVSLVQLPYLQSFDVAATDATCGQPNGTISITGWGGYTGTVDYSFQQSTFTSGHSLPLIFSNLASSTYIISAKDANNCLVTQNIAVASASAPTAVQVQIQDVTCNQNNGCATVSNVTGGISPYQYSFNGSAFSAQNQYCSLASGTYTFTVRDANLCELTSDVVVSSLQPPSVSILLNEPVRCFGESNGKATATITGGQQPFTIQWSNGENALQALSLAAGQHQVIITDANNCSSTASIDMVQPDVLVSSVVFQKTTCGLANGRIEFVNTTGGNLPYQYGLVNQALSTNTVLDNLSAGTYQVFISDSKGCNWQQSVVIDTISYPTLIAHQKTDATCGLPNGNWIITGITGGIAPYSYSYQYGQPELFNGTMAFDQLNQGQYTLNIVDSNGCSISAQTTILQFEGPTSVNATLTPATCELHNAAIAINSVNSGTSPFTYSINNSPFITISDYNGMAGGTYQYAIKDANGCMLDTVFHIQTIPTVKINAVLTQRVRCFGESNGAAKVIINQGTSPFSIAWQSGSQSLVQQNLSEGLEYVIVTDAYGCIDSASVYVPQPTPIAVSITGKNEFCLGDSTTLSVTSTGGGVHHSYIWHINNSYYPVQHFKPETTTDYIVTATDILGCTGTDTLQVIVNQPLPLDIKANIKIGCAPVCIEFIPIADVNQIATFSWTFENGLTSDLSNPKNCYYETGPVSAALNIVDIHGCFNHVSYDTIAYVYPDPQAKFTTSDFVLDIATPQTTFLNQSTPAPIYYWTFGDGTTVFETHPTHTYADTGRYEVCLLVQTEFTCQNKTCQYIDVVAKPTVYIPTAFSPNDDGLNDVFKIEGTYLKSAELFIFNRWGEQLFFSNDINKGWNGSYNGNTAENDVYVWKAKIVCAFGEVIEKTGKVALVR